MEMERTNLERMWGDINIASSSKGDT